MVNRFEHLLEEYNIITDLSSKVGPSREVSRRMLIFTEALAGIIAMSGDEEPTKEEAKTLMELLAKNREAQKIIKHRMKDEF